MKNLILTALLFLVSTTAAHAGEVYDRVMAAGKIRCGYAVWAPAFTVDPNAGALGGIFYDLVMEMGNIDCGVPLHGVW